MEKLPSEVLSIIFSFLDKKSSKSATATCQLWFDLIRNSNSSNHICYKGSVEELQRRIANLKWDWKRWPALKIFEQRGYSVKRDLLRDLSIDFKQCPTLEIVIFDAFIDIADFFPNCTRNVAKIIKLAFNPQLDITQFGVDHIWSLYILKQNDEVFKLINENLKGLKELSVGNLSYLDNLDCMDALLELRIENGNSSSELEIAGLKKLKKLKVCKLAQLDNLVGMDGLLELCVTSVSGPELKEYDLSNIAKHFKNLQKCEICVPQGIDFALLFPNCPRNVAMIGKLAYNSPLDIIQFDVDHIWSLGIREQNDEVSKLINENIKGLKELGVRKLSYLNNLVCMDALLKLHIINDNDNYSPELKIAGLKKLKTLEVGKLAQLDNLVGINAICELSVEDVSGRELKEYDLSNIAKRFKNLQKCDICVNFVNNLIQPKEYAQIVQDIFQNSATRVEIVFVKSHKNRGCPIKTYLTKEPFQRCVVK